MSITTQRRKQQQLTKSRASLVGKKFSLLLVVSQAANKIKGGQNYRQWNCICACGGRVVAFTHQLRKGYTKRCKACNEQERLMAVRKRPYEWLYNKLMKESTIGVNVKNRTTTQRAFTLTYDQFACLAKTSLCHYCYTPVEFTKHYKRGVRQGHNLDRRDNAHGYHLRNIVVCCYRCNSGKGDQFTYDEWWAMTACFRARRGLQKQRRTKRNC